MRSPAEHGRREAAKGFRRFSEALSRQPQQFPTFLMDGGGATLRLSVSPGSAATGPRARRMVTVCMAARSRRPGPVGRSSAGMLLSRRLISLSRVEPGADDHHQVENRYEPIVDRPNGLC